MNKPTESLKNRLKKALSEREMTQQDLADKTGISKSSISQYLSGYAKPKDDRVYAISLALNINEAWLLGYDVPMERGVTNDTPDPYYIDPEVAEIAQQIKDNPGKRALFDATRDVSKEDIEKVLQIISVITKDD